MANEAKGVDGWEYNAPQYVDFSSPQLDDVDADKWFDLDHEGKSVVKQFHLSEEIEPSTPKASHQSKPNEKLQGSDSDSLEKHEVTEAPQEVKGNSGICSLDEWREKTRGKKRIHSNQAQQNAGQDTRRKSPRIQSAETKSAVKRHKSFSAADRSGSRLKKNRQSPYISADKTVPEACRPTSGVKPEAKHNTGLKKSYSMNKSRPTCHERVGHRRGLSADRSLPVRTRTGNNSNDNAHRIPRITIPSEPSFMKKKLSKNTDIKKTEDLEMERIAVLREELAKKRKQAQDSYRKAITSAGYKPVLSCKEATIPKEFHFTTDSRLKNNPAEHSETSSREGQRSPTRNVRTNLHPTIPKPFNLTESKRRKGEVSENGAAEFKSVAARVKAFHKKTPERFHTLPKDSAHQKQTRSKSPMKLTHPKAPQLQTGSRTRSVLIPSHQELEEKELEEIDKNQFKANPVNYKIINNPNTGIRKVEPRPPTKIEEFSLTSDKHMLTREATKEPLEEKYEFRAQPVPTKILDGVVGLKPAKEIPITIPQSPAFALKHRSRIPVEVPEETAAQNGLIKAIPVPHTGIPFQPKLAHRTTEPEPFTFEERNRVMLARKEEKIQEILAEETKSHEFHANPMPSPTAETLPVKNSKCLTKFQLFSLESEHRGQKKADEWNQHLEEELRQQKNLSKFKAKSSTVVHQDPFVAQKSTRPLTDISEFELNTERRTIHREAFEMNKKSKEAESESMKHNRELQQQEEEKEAVAKLRSDMVHKPNPIRKYKTVDPVLPEPLTAPESPQLLTTTRLRNKVRV